MLVALACAAILPAAATAAAAASPADYPTRPIRLVVPWTAAGTTDLVARSVAERLGARLGQPVVVENRPGATGLIGTQQVAQAAPDGYTLLLMSATVHTVSPNLKKSYPLDPIDDFTPISQVVSFPYVMVVPAKSPYHSVVDVAEAARKAPGKVSYGSFGLSSSPFLISELFALSTDTKLLHVPYKGAAPAIQDLLGGYISFFIDSLPSPLGQIRGGQLRALAVTPPQRSPILPDVPTMAETIPGFEAIAWIGIGAPANLPAPIAERLNRELQAIAAEPAYQQKLRDMGLEAVANKSPAEFRSWLQAQKQYWGDFVQKAHIPLSE
ncbi:MAG TPA: tripartite tricarboxylate transporter substrate binding protein [Bordetella sp.]|nr:tripartite tricarboxylate transporter substrate binding protein [Bordetella sp.]